MRRCWVRGMLMAEVSLTAAGCGSGGSHADQTPKLGPPQVAEIRAAVSKQLGSGLATAYSLAVWRDGHVIYAEAFGERADGVAATASTQFQIGSDTKKLTALAVLRAVESGKLSLADSVADVLPGLDLAQSPHFLSTVTVADLLRQTSGLYDYTPWTEAPDDGELAAIGYGRFAENEYAFLPAGIAYRYANPNYSLAGLLVEKVEGRPWADVIGEDILRPLGLSHTHARRDDMLKAESDVASGVGNRAPLDFFSPSEEPQLELGTIEPADEIDNAFLRPAGLVWSTPTDQAHLLGFFIDGDDQVISAESRGQMMAVQSPLYNHLKGAGYGYGLVHQDAYRDADGVFYPAPLVWHDGGTQSMTSLSLMLPEQRVAISVLANGAGEDLALVADTALRVAATGRLPDPIDDPHALGDPSPDLESYAGQYADPNLGEVTISWQDSQLVVESPLLAEAGVEVGALVPAGRDLFSIAIDGAPYDISFYDGADGSPHKYGVNREFVLTRH